MALTDSLISYWKMDEASGNALDAHGSNELTDNNTVGSTTGVIGNARQLASASSENFSHADNADLSFGNEDFTWAGWVYFASNGVFQTVLNKGTVDGSGEYTLYRYSDDVLYWLVTNGAGTSGQPSAAIGGSGWHHVVVWHDSVNNEVGFSIDDGTPVTVSFSAGCNDGGGTFYFGREPGGSYLNGRLDEWGLWGRVLTSGERTQLYNGGAGLSYDDFGGGETTTNPSPVVITAATAAPTLSLSQAGTAVGGISTTVAPALSSSLATTPVVSTSAIATPEQSASHTVAAVTSTSSTVAPAATISNDTGAVTFTGAIAGSTPTISALPNATTVTSTTVAPSLSLSYAATAITASLSVPEHTAAVGQLETPSPITSTIACASPSLSLSQGATPVTGTFSVPDAIAGRIESPNAVVSNIAVALHTLSLSYAMASVVGTFTVPAVTTTGGAPAAVITAVVYDFIDVAYVQHDIQDVPYTQADFLDIP